MPFTALDLFIPSAIKLPITCILIGALLSTTAIAAEYVISDDGKQILLNDDGSWVQVSKDRYATTASGQRIRLKPDGNWSVINKTDSDKQPETSVLSLQSDVNPYNKDDVGLLLNKVEILKKKTKTQKSKRIDTRTVYHLSVINNGNKALQLDNLALDNFTARSSGKDTFEILAANSSHAILKPGQRATLVVVTNGSPKWFGIKYLTIELAKNTLGHSSPRILSKNIDDVDVRTVEHF